MHTMFRTVMKIAAILTVASVCIIIVFETTNTAHWHSATSVSFIEHIVPTLKEFDESFSSDTLAVHFTNFAQALEARADADRYIILVMTDEGFIDMAINFYEVSLRAHQLDNFLFVGLGRSACKILGNMSIPCFYYADDQNAGIPSDFGGQAFNRKVNVRNDMIIEALAVNITVIHCDTDIVFIGNPVEHLKGIMKHSDLAAMRDYKTLYNSGFVVVKPTAVNRRIYAMMQDISRKTEKMHDQQILNIVIGMLHRQKIQTRATYLEKSLYMDGEVYFEHMRRLLPKKNDPCSSVNKTKCSVLVVHNNCMVSTQAKIYRFREHLMWSYDGKDRYYTSESRKYIMYTNPTSISKVSVRHLLNRQMSSFRTALVLGYLLDRAVILPRFYCRAYLTPCPLNSYIGIATLDIFFKGKYRESTFLQHPKVPATVKHNISYSPLLSYATRLSSVSNDSTIDSNNVVRLFHGKKDSLINFGILDGMQVTFSDDYTKNEFNQRIHEAFLLSEYRQVRHYGNLW